MPAKKPKRKGRKAKTTRKKHKLDAKAMERIVKAAVKHGIVKKK